MNIAVNPFVKRQTVESQFSHFTGTWDELLQRVQRNYEAGRFVQGYRDGVILVEVESGVPEHPGCFYTSITQLKEGDKLAGEYKCRQVGEDPRKSTWVVGGKKMPAQSVQVVLSRHDVLVENNEQSSDADWEIISINASPFTEKEEMPMPVGTLMANHFQVSGGTATNMTDSEFVIALKKSFMFWKDKATVAPVWK
jgi:hypothetical protein